MGTEGWWWESHPFVGSTFSKTYYSVSSLKHISMKSLTRCTSLTSDKESVLSQQNTVPSLASGTLRSPEILCLRVEGTLEFTPLTMAQADRSIPWNLSNC